MENIVTIKIGNIYTEFYTNFYLQLKKKYNFKFNLILNSKKTNISFLKYSKKVDKNDKVYLQDSVYSKLIDYENLQTEASRIEKEYKCKLAFLMSQDRAYGQGFLFTVPLVPEIKRSNWGNEKKLLNFVNLFLFYEQIILGSKMFIEHRLNSISYTITKAKNIPSFSLATIKLGDNVFWSENQYLTNKKFLEDINKNLSNKKVNTTEQYAIESDAIYRRTGVNYNYLNAFKSSFKMIIIEIKNFIMNTKNKNSYNYFAWIKNNFIAVRNYKYLKKISIKKSDIKNKKIIFFPLHLEPEVSLLNVSPEFSNSLEVISLIAKNLPFDTVLILKEQIFSFPVRSINFYKQLKKIYNVEFADPEIHSWEWIKDSKIIVSITGTVGIEAIMMKKKVISFGAHQAINLLPSVKYVSNFEEVKKAMEELIETHYKDDELDHFKNSYLLSQKNNSFELKNLKSSDFGDFDISMVDLSIKKLVETYPEIFDNLKYE
tara:strand:- start:1321 stop:2781 length:1461 start_codon:yes stop_codon:yes gene_type:complete